MASMAIAASSMQVACSSHQVKKTQQPPPKQPVRSIDTTKVSSKPHVLTLNIEEEGENGSYVVEKGDNNSASSHIRKPENGKDDMETGPRLLDDRWKNGTWDLNMFVKDAKIDWDGVIVAEARRRKFLELCPQASTNHEPVLFRTSIIPWWAWLKRSHLPEAELINGRAAMVGFFMAYLVDVLTKLDMVGQTGNFVCKAGMFVTVVGVILFRRTQDFDSLKKLADEATFYDKQWRSSWEDHNNASNTRQGKKK